MATTKESKKPASSTNALDLYKKLTLVRKAEDSVCYRDANTGSVVQITDLTNATSVRNFSYQLFNLARRFAHDKFKFKSIGPPSAKTQIRNSSSGYYRS